MVARWFATGAVLSGLGVLVGAFGAHGLEDVVTPAEAEVYDTGVRYHLIHGLALLAVAWAASRWPGAWVSTAGWSFVVGIVVFSGSLYVLALTEASWWGAVTPFGGVGFLVGWAAMAAVAFRATAQER